MSYWSFASERFLNSGNYSICNHTLNGIRSPGIAAKFTVTLVWNPLVNMLTPPLSGKRSD